MIYHFRDGFLLMLAILLVALTIVWLAKALMAWLNCSPLWRVPAWAFLAIVAASVFWGMIYAVEGPSA